MQSRLDLNRWTAGGSSSEGDLDGDGKINMKDWNRVYAHINKTELLTEYALQCGDVNGDGTVNMKDWKRIYDHINKTELLW